MKNNLYLKIVLTVIAILLFLNVFATFTIQRYEIVRDVRMDNLVYRVDKVTNTFEVTQPSQ